MNKQALTFDKNGYLTPYDSIPTTLITVEEAFVTNPVRQQLWERYRQFLKALHKIVPVVHKQWIDGSFVSQRENPGDIDVIVFVPHTHFAGIAHELKKLKEACAGSIDCYFVETFPPDHRNVDISRADELTWYYFLRVDRRNRPKGILELIIDYGNQG